MSWKIRGRFINQQLGTIKRKRGRRFSLRHRLQTQKEWEATGKDIEEDAESPRSSARDPISKKSPGIGGLSSEQKIAHQR
jgi:hypothetical protein